MALYKLQKVDPEFKQEFVVKNPDGNPRVVIPFTNGKTVYQEYLEWVAAGNTAEAAD